MIKKFFLGICVFLFAAVSLADSLPYTKIEIQTEKENIVYQIELADTPIKMELGLMNRKNLPQNQGMLFLFSNPQIVQMWMKNTYIALDMLFIDSDNQIVSIHKNAHPLDKTLISSLYSITKVLEINAGEVQKNQIKIGQKIRLK